MPAEVKGPSDSNVTIFTYGVVQQYNDSVKTLLADISTTSKCDVPILKQPFLTESGLGSFLSINAEEALYKFSECMKVRN